jgi:hypothetical protein
VLIRKILFALAVSAELTALSACSNDPSTIVETPNTVDPLPPPSSVAQDNGFIWSAEEGFKVIATPSYAEAIDLTGINNLGQVIGYVTLHFGKGDDRAIIWSPAGGLQRLGSLKGPDGVSWPVTIDDNGVVFGLGEGPSTRQDATGSGPFDPFVWSASTGIQPASYPVYKGPSDDSTDSRDAAAAQVNALRGAR